MLWTWRASSPWGQWCWTTGGTGTVLYCTLLYCTVLSTVLQCTVLRCTILYCTVLYCAVLYCTVQPHTMYCTGFLQAATLLSSLSRHLPHQLVTVHTLSVLSTKQGVLPILKNRFPTISAA